jgi:hypothetical protein
MRNHGTKLSLQADQQTGRESFGYPELCLTPEKFEKERKLREAARRARGHRGHSELLGE